MKNKFSQRHLPALALILTVFATQLAAQTPATTPPTKPGIGITDVFDDVIHLNHNQLLKKILLDNPATMDGAPLTVDLVEHPSQALLAVGAMIKQNAVVVSLYKEGRLSARDTTRIEKLESPREIYSILCTVINSPDGLLISDLSPQSDAYEKGIRNGFLLKEINNTPLHAGQQNEAQAMLESTENEPVNIKALNPETEQVFALRVKRYPFIGREWARPLNTEQLELVFQAILNSMAKNQKTLGLTFKKPQQLSTKSMSVISALNSSRKCYSYEQIPVYERTFMHYLQPGIGVDSIFIKEAFYSPRKKNKKAQPGDASLNAMRYYNFDQNKSHLSKNDHIEDNMKEVVRKLSGPFYNKPGVFANYFIAAKEYENARNYQAALNQYYASLRKVDEIIASEMTKTRAKAVVLGRIAYCSKQINQTNYAELMLLAKDCLEMTLKNAELKQSDQNFYKFSKETLELCRDIEGKLEQQRSQKTMAIINAVASAGMGVMSLNLDTGLASSFFLSAAATMDQNAALNSQLNSILWETTSSINFNLPAELQDDESSPYEIVATAYINYAVERVKDKYAVLNRIALYAADRPALKQVVLQAKQNYESSENNLFDHSELISMLVKNEKIIYRYEKRGLKVPETAVP